MHDKLTGGALAFGLACVLVLAGCSGAVTSGSSAGSAQAVGSADQTVAAADTGSAAAAPAAALEDGVYVVDVATDSSMFHINESLNGKGRLTVEDGKMTVHMTLASTGILNLYAGTAEDAQEDGAQLIDHTTDTVTYEDGTTEEVYGFDVPVPALDQEFDVALVGTKGKWYDHKVTVSNPVLSDGTEPAIAAAE